MRRFHWPCSHETQGEVCGALPTRRYLNGHRCEQHTPAALAGRSEVAPDPDRTLAALQSTRVPAAGGAPVPLAAGQPERGAA